MPLDWFPFWMDGKFGNIKSRSIRKIEKQKTCKLSNIGAVIPYILAALLTGDRHVSLINISVQCYYSFSSMFTHKKSDSIEHST